MGPHACAGANLIRMAMKQITLPLVTRFKTARIAEPVEWQGGWVFRSPRSLWVHLGQERLRKHPLNEGHGFSRAVQKSK
jgi:hypothetical protein